MGQRISASPFWNPLGRFSAGLTMLWNRDKQEVASHIFSSSAVRHFVRTIHYGPSGLEICVFDRNCFYFPCTRVVRFRTTLWEFSRLIGRI